MLPDVLNVIALADFFQVTTDYLLRGVSTDSAVLLESDRSIIEKILAWIRNRDHWLWIFLALYLVFLVILWVLVIEPAPKRFPVG